MNQIQVRNLGQLERLLRALPAEARSVEVEARQELIETGAEVPVFEVRGPLPAEQMMHLARPIEHARGRCSWCKRSGAAEGPGA